MASPYGFHFVNPGNGSADGHKAPSKARAFVAQNTRTGWSTKSQKNNDRRRGRRAEGQRLLTEAVRSRETEGIAMFLAARSNTDVATYDGVLKKQHLVPRRLVTGASPVCTFCNAYIGDPETPNSVAVCSFCSGKPTAQEVRLPLAVMDGLLSPFGSAAASVEPSCMSLLAFFTAAISPPVSPTATQPVQHPQHYLTTLLSNSACMYAFLCLAALQLGILQPDNQTEYFLQAMQFRVQAVAAIQKNLAQLDTAVSDENIAAVFNLLCVEENLFLPTFDDGVGDTQLRPDHAQRLAHMEGLKTLINLRGGAMALGQSRALQMFLIRHSAVQAAVSFEPSYFLPRNLFRHIFHYPESSPFYNEPCPMAAACTAGRVNAELTEIIKSAECLMKDTTAGSGSPHGHEYNGDLLDIQNLFSAIISQFVQWNVENSSTCSPVEGVISLCLVIFMCFVMRGRQTVYGPLLSCLTRLRPYFDSSTILKDLRRIGLDVWVGLLVVIGSAGHLDYEDFFFQIYLKALAENDIRSFDELLGHLTGSIWIPQPMNLYVWEIWRETPKNFREQSELPSEQLHQLPRKRCAPVAAKRPISLLGFPALKLDHTDSTVIRK